MNVQQLTVSYRRRGPSITFGVLSVGLAILTARAVAHSDSTLSPILIALLALAWATILLNFPPEILFLSWLALAPFLQGPAEATFVGHALVLAVYLAPPLILALWTYTQPSDRYSPGFIDALPLLYFLYVLASFLLTSDPSLTSMKGIFTTVGIGIILYYFFAFGPIGSLSWENVTAVILVVAALEALMSIVDSVTGWNLWQDAGWQDGIPRAVATLGNPAVLGTFIGIGVVLALAVLVWGGASHLRKLALATIVIGLPGIFLTYTRAPVLAVVLVGLAILLTRAQTRLLGLCLLIIATIVLAISWGRITESPVYRERVANESNIEGRLLLQDWSLKLAADRPLFGWGYDSYDRVKNAANLSSPNVPRSFGIDYTSHNTYLTVLVQYGGVGLVLMLLPWLVLTWRAVTDALARPETRWFVVGSIAAVVVYAVNAATLDMRFFSLVPAMPWLFLGLLRRSQLSKNFPRSA